MPRRQINVRIEDDEMYFYLIGMENYSFYLRELITKDLIAKGNTNILEARIKEHEKAIRDLRQFQTKAKELPNTDQILQKCYNLYKSGHIDETDVTNIHRWIRAHVLPDLAKAGRRDIDSHKVLEVFSGMDK